MARRQPTDDEAKDSLIDRRSYLQLASTVGAAATATFGASMAASSQEADTSEVVNLGDVGLSQGDVIDPYFEEYFRDGTEIRVPEGEYDWNGEGLHFNANRDAAIVGEGEVILNAADQDHNNTIIADGGTLELRNLTIRGKVDDGRIRLETEGENDKVLVENVNFPDGALDDAGRTICFYVPGNHSGVIEFRHCYIRGFSDNGIYASSPGKGDGGQIVIDGCVAHNNNITGFRLGGRDSVIRNSVVINDDTAPVPQGISHNQRGIRIDNSEHNENMRIENVDIIHSGSTSTLGGGGPIRITDRAADSTGHVENVRILNNVDIEAIFPYDQYADGWTGNDIHVSGSGDLAVPSWFENVTTGANAEQPTPSLDDLPNGDGNDGNDGNDGSDGDDGDDGNPGAAGSELVLVTDESGGIEYSFTATDEIVPLRDREDYPANTVAPADTVAENDDGTWTATGATSGASHSGDSFAYQGDVVNCDVTGDVDALTVYRDGTDVTETFLAASDSDPDDGNSGDDGSNDDGTATELVVSTEPSDGFEYAITTSDEIEPMYDRAEYPADPGDLGESAAQNDDGTWTAQGALSGSSYSGDTFSYQGDVVGFDAEGDLSGMTLLRDGQEVSQDELVVDDGNSGDDGDDSDDGAAGDLSNLLIVDGTQSDDVTTYGFAVTGEVERDSALSTVPEDADGVDANVEDDVGNTAVEGIVGKGIDGYRYSGSIVDFEFSGVATLTIESASE